MTFSEFQAINAERSIQWHGEETQPLAERSIGEWALAMAGECGETCNVVKKINRVRNGIPGNTETESELYDNLKGELADTVTYAFLLAEAAGFDLGEVCVVKFNHISLKQGLPQRILGEETPRSPEGDAPPRPSRRRLPNEDLVCGHEVRRRRDLPHVPVRHRLHQTGVRGMTFREYVRIKRRIESGIAVSTGEAVRTLAMWDAIKHLPWWRRRWLAYRAWRIPRDWSSYD